MTKPNFTTWGKFFLQWTAYVGPVIITLIALNAYFYPRSEAATAINEIKNNQEQFVVQFSQLRDALTANSSELARLNGYLQAQAELKNRKP